MSVIYPTYAEISAAEINDVRLPISITKLTINGNDKAPVSLRGDVNFAAFPALKELEIVGCDLSENALMFATVNKGAELFLIGCVMPADVDLSRAAEAQLFRNDFAKTIQFQGPESYTHDLAERFIHTLKIFNNNWDMTKYGNGAAAVNRNRLAEMNQTSALITAVCKCNGKCKEK